MAARDAYPLRNGRNRDVLADELSPEVGQFAGWCYHVVVVYVVTKGLSTVW